MVVCPRNQRRRQLIDELPLIRRLECRSRLDEQDPTKQKQLTVTHRREQTVQGARIRQPAEECCADQNLGRSARRAPRRFAARPSGQQRHKSFPRARHDRARPRRVGRKGRRLDRMSQRRQTLDGPAAAGQTSQHIQQQGAGETAADLVAVMLAGELFGEQPDPLRRQVPLGIGLPFGVEHRSNAGAQHEQAARRELGTPGGTDRDIVRDEPNGQGGHGLDLLRLIDDGQGFDGRKVRPNHGAQLARRQHRHHRQRITEMPVSQPGVDQIELATCRQQLGCRVGAHLIGRQRCQRPEIRQEAAGPHLQEATSPPKKEEHRHTLFRRSLQQGCDRRRGRRAQSLQLVAEAGQIRPVRAHLPHEGFADWDPTPRRRAGVQLVGDECARVAEIEVFAPSERIAHGPGTGGAMQFPQQRRRQMVVEPDEVHLPTAALQPRAQRVERAAQDLRANSQVRPRPALRVVRRDRCERVGCQQSAQGGAMIVGEIGDRIRRVVRRPRKKTARRCRCRIGQQQHFDEVSAGARQQFARQQVGQASHSQAARARLDSLEPFRDGGVRDAGRQAKCLAYRRRLRRRRDGIAQVLARDRRQAERHAIGVVHQKRHLFFGRLKRSVWPGQVTRYVSVANAHEVARHDRIKRHARAGIRRLAGGDHDGDERRGGSRVLVRRLRIDKRLLDDGLPFMRRESAASGVKSLLRTKPSQAQPPTDPVRSRADGRTGRARLRVAGHADAVARARCGWNRDDRPRLTQMHQRCGHRFDTRSHGGRHRAALDRGQRMRSRVDVAIEQAADRQRQRLRQCLSGWGPIANRQRARRQIADERGVQTAERSQRAKRSEQIRDRGIAHALVAGRCADRGCDRKTRAKTVRLELHIGPQQRACDRRRLVRQESRERAFDLGVGGESFDQLERTRKPLAQCAHCRADAFDAM